jgi:hypothetical protein
MRATAPWISDSGALAMKTVGLPLAAMAFALCTSGAPAQTAKEIRGPAGVVPLAGEEPPAKIIVDPPLADSLAQGRVVIQYRAENLRIVQVFGPAALGVSPRIGHIHVTVDDAPWRWADASGEPLIINGLPAGPHKVLVELVDANHRTLEKRVVTFSVPEAR